MIQYPPCHIIEQMSPWNLDFTTFHEKCIHNLSLKQLLLNCMLRLPDHQTLFPAESSSGGGFLWVPPVNLPASDGAVTIVIDY